MKFTVNVKTPLHHAAPITDCLISGQNEHDGRLIIHTKIASKEIHWEVEGDESLRPVLEAMVNKCRLFGGESKLIDESCLSNAS